MVRARPGDEPACRPLPWARAQARRPRCLADAEPHCAHRSLSCLLQGRSGHDAAQLSLHAAGDRSRARGERGPYHPRSRRARQGHRREQGGRPAARRHYLRRRGEQRPALRATGCNGAAGRRTCGARGRGAGCDLLHLGLDRAGQRRDPQLLLARLHVRERCRGLRADPGRYHAAGLVLLASRWVLLLDGGARRRRAGGRGQVLRPCRARAAIACYRARR